MRTAEISAAGRGHTRVAAVEVRKTPAPNPGLQAELLRPGEDRLAVPRFGLEALAPGEDRLAVPRFGLEALAPGDDRLAGI
jgi:hypothetical protein